MNEKDIYSQEKIDEMRERLYSRGAHFKNVAERHELKDKKVDVSRDWKKVESEEKRVSDLREGMEADLGDGDINLKENKPERKKRGYRTFVLIGSLVIFVLVAIVSSLFLYFGGNQISGENIHLTISGPKTVGGGEVVSMQVGVTNQNTVPISSATLILKYPEGTRSTGDNPRTIYEERVSLDSLAPGEVKNVPIRVAVFGEENAEKLVNATIEYRIENSNGMFYKDAEPLSLKITSAPLVLRVDAVEKVASGQLVDLNLTVVSNANSPLKDVLVSADYPNGFSFERSVPEPVYGQNVWKIDEILPEESVEIKLEGVVSGLTEESFRINFEAGQADFGNQYIVTSTLADTGVEMTIERPFVGVDVEINKSKEWPAIISQGENAEVEVEVTNTLDETIYDMVIEVVPKGNALNKDSIKGKQGFYDSNTGTVRWEVSNNESFSQILPGDTRILNFQVVPNSVRTTASFDLTVNVYARRVSESSAAETLIGTVDAEAKYSSTVFVGSQVGRSVAGFVDGGPIPPKVGEASTYTVTLVAEAGSNNLTNTVVNTSLPVYVEWLDSYEGDGELTYNSVSKQIEWNVGGIASGQKKELNLQLSLTPSISQAGRSATLLNKQTIKANDRFTGELLREEANAVTTELSEEMGYEEDNGIIEE